MAAGSRRFFRGVGRSLRGSWSGRSAGFGLCLFAGLLATHSPVRGAVDVSEIVPPTRFTDPLIGPSDVVPARVALGPQGRDVRLSGELTEGVADRLTRLLDAHPDVERIHLTSEGGLVDEGAAIGALVARRGLVTYVPDYCVSACTLAFVRGRERLVLEGARLGFHAPYEAGPFGIEIEADSAPERAAYLAAGIEPAFVDAALKVRPDDLMVPDAARLIAARVATGVVDVYRFPDSTLDDGPDPIHARALVLRSVPILTEIERAAPDIVRDLVAWYLDGYAQGRSEGEAIDGLRRRAAHVVAGAFREAEPTTLLALGRTTLRMLNRVGPERDGTCAAASEGLGAVLTRSGIGEPELAIARAIFPRNPVLDPSPETSPLASRDCADLRRAFSAALAHPSPEAARALRPLFFPEGSLAHVTAQAE